MQKTSGVCRLVLVCERESLCNATQLLGKDGETRKKAGPRKKCMSKSLVMTSVKREPAFFGFEMVRKNPLERHVTMTLLAHGTMVCQAF